MGATQLGCVNGCIDFLFLPTLRVVLDCVMRYLVEMDENNNISSAAKMLEYAIDVRGRIITATVILESTMDMFLASHFCKSDSAKAIEILETIFATRKFTFENKNDTICQILERNISYGLNKADIVKLSKAFKNISKERNIVAHCKVDISIESIDMFLKKNILNFIKYANSAKPIPYNVEKIQSLTNSINKTTHQIYSLY